MRTYRTFRFALAITVLSGAFLGSASAQNQPGTNLVAQPQAPTPAQYALALLQRAADRLSTATLSATSQSRCFGRRTTLMSPC